MKVLVILKNEDLEIFNEAMCEIYKKAKYKFDDGTNYAFKCDFQGRLKKEYEPSWVNGVLYKTPNMLVENNINNYYFTMLKITNHLYFIEVSGEIRIWDNIIEKYKVMSLERDREINNRMN